jgi:N-acetylneuraminate synthase
MKAGEVLTAENLRIIRPGYGLAPKYYDVLLGQRVNEDLEKGTAVEWSYLG